MATLLLDDALNENAKLLIELAKKLGVKVVKLAADEKEDLIFAQMMLKEETGEYVSEDKIYKLLEGD
jgi:hypothetical protein